MQTVSRKPSLKSWLTFDMMAAYTTMDDQSVRQFLKDQGWLRKQKKTTPTATALKQKWMVAYQNPQANIRAFYGNKKAFLALCEARKIPCANPEEYEFNLLWDDMVPLLDRYSDNGLPLLEKAIRLMLQQRLPQTMDHAFYLKLQQRFQNPAPYKLNEKAWEVVLSCLPMHVINQEILQKSTVPTAPQSEQVVRRL